MQEARKDTVVGMRMNTETADVLRWLARSQRRTLSDFMRLALEDIAERAKRDMQMFPTNNAGKDA